MANDFSTYRNLLYYPGQPSRLFYFASLQFPGSNAGNLWQNPDYRRRSLAIAGYGHAYLEDNILTNEQGMLTKGSQKYEQKRATIQKFLELAIQTQKQSEVAYFKNMISTIQNKFKDKPMPQAVTNLIHFFQKVGSGLSFDYNTYIIYINELLQGENTTKNVISYERERLNQVQTWSTEAEVTLAADIAGGKDKYYLLSKARQNIFRHQAAQILRARYMETKHISQSTSTTKTNVDKQITAFMLQIPSTIDNQIADFSEQLINFLTTDEKVIDQIKTNLIQFYGKNTNTQPDATLIRNQVINLAIAWADRHLDIILQKIPNDKNFKQIETDVINDLSTLNGLYSFEINNIPKTLGGAQQIQFFTKTLNNGERSAKGLYQIIQNFNQQINKAKTLTDSQKMIKELLELEVNGQTSSHNSQLLNQLNKLEQLQATIIKQMKEEKKTEAAISFETINKILFDNKGKGDESIKLNVILEGKIIKFQPVTTGNNSSPGVNTLISLLEKNNFITGRKSSAATLNGLIGSLKGQASNYFRDVLTEKIINSGKTKIANVVQTYLESMQINIKGSTVSELLAGIRLSQKSNGELVLHFGSDINNNKTDFAVISLNPSAKKLKELIKNEWEPLLGDTIRKPLQQLYEAKEKAVRDWQQAFISDMQNLKIDSSGFHDYKAKAESFFTRYQQHQMELSQLYQELETANGNLKNLREQIKSNTQLVDKQKQEIATLLHQLKHELYNSIYRSDTMKTYNQYQNKIGFLGGSIGTNLAQQINSINMLFEQAGMGMNDYEIDLLTDLILNTSYHSIIGTHYKGVIERYMSAIAAFTLFDEGGAELEMLAAQFNNLPKPSGPQILHMYRLNGVYYPGSYILTETLKGVMELGKVMTVNTHGARVSIYNPITEKVIPNRPWHAGDPILDTDPWGTVSKQAQASVQLQITFMAGMLQVMENLQKAMNDITIPA